MILKLPEEISFNTFEKDVLAHVATKLARAKPGVKITLKLTETRYADLMEAMCMSIVAEQFRGAGMIPEFKFYSREGSGIEEALIFNRFMQRWGFPKFVRSLDFRIDLENRFEIDPERILAITDLSVVNLKDLKEDVIKIFRVYFSWLSNQQLMSLVDQIISEACENIYLHAYKKQHDSHKCMAIAIRCYKAAPRGLGMWRYLNSPYWFRRLMVQYPGTDFLELAIIDGGIGIFESLKNQFIERRSQQIREKYGREPEKRDLSELACLHWVLSPIPTSRLKKRGKGFGIYTLGQMATQGWGGAVYIRTGQTRLVLLPASTDPVETENLTRFPGTQIRFLLPIIDRTNEITSVINEIMDQIGTYYEAKAN